MITSSSEAIRECIINNRPVTMLGTLSADTERLRHYIVNLKQAAYASLALRSKLLGKR